ncbi:MAG: hypothetical protein K9N46_09285 [Candidatus Marinimicrobia bacterium]|nr:hypothetical protein [Candidatus Neomarinimicrobiota bacterium]MCF7829432.1 hypothetical protein [Candidatus Neomarinimicrobiota bacterium]MCF7880918.1 hypothetical protein [Candidatus Neomarinimicrobiota bacterium]
MKALEEIHIRVTEGTRDELISKLRVSLRNRDQFPELEFLHIYYHARYETDLCLHLSWDGSLPVQGSTLALNILAGGRELGSVKHTVWIESGV